MRVVLPESSDCRLSVVLALAPRRHREDAIQEAWVAYLEGREPHLGADQFRLQERRHDARHVHADKLLGNNDASNNRADKRNGRTQAGTRKLNTKLYRRRLNQTMASIRPGDAR